MLSWHWLYILWHDEVLFSQAVYIPVISDASWICSGSNCSPVVSMGEYTESLLSGVGPVGSCVSIELSFSTPFLFIVAGVMFGSLSKTGLSSPFRLLWPYVVQRRHSPHQLLPCIRDVSTSAVYRILYIALDAFYLSFCLKLCRHGLCYFSNEMTFAYGMYRE